MDVDDEGELHVTPVKPNQARQLIEELMLLANRLVAQELSDKDIPALYRVHEDPSEAKIQALQGSLGKLGYEIGHGARRAARPARDHPAGRRANPRRNSSTRCCCAPSNKLATARTTWGTSV